MKPYGGPISIPVIALLHDLPGGNSLYSGQNSPGIPHGKEVSDALGIEDVRVKLCDSGSAIDLAFQREINCLQQGGFPGLIVAHNNVELRSNRQIDFCKGSVVLYTDSFNAH